MVAEICVAGFLSRLDRGSLRSGTVVVLFRSCRYGNRDSGCLGHLIPFCSVRDVVSPREEPTVPPHVENRMLECPTSDEREQLCLLWVSLTVPDRHHPEGRGRPSANPAADWTPRTARSANSGSERAPAYVQVLRTPAQM